MIKVLIVHVVTARAIKIELVCRPNVGDIFPLDSATDKVISVVFATGLVIQQVPDAAGCDLLVYVE